MVELVRLHNLCPLKFKRSYAESLLCLAAHALHCVGDRLMDTACYCFVRPSLRVHLKSLASPKGLGIGKK